MLVGKKGQGIVASYAVIILNIVSGLVATPFLIHRLGQSEYGLYQLVAASISYLSLVDFGMAATTTRFAVKYAAEGDEERLTSLIATILAINGLLALICVVVGVSLSDQFDRVFSASLTAAELETARRMFIVMTITVAISFFQNTFVGLANAAEAFVFNGFLKVFRIAAHLLILVILVALGKGIYSLVLFDLWLSLLIALIAFLYCRGYLKIRFSLQRIDTSLARSVFTFSIPMLIQSIVNRLNNSTGRFLLGVMSDTSTVGLYSVGMQIYMLFAGFSSAVSTVYQPKITRMVFSHRSQEDILGVLIRTGRLQLIVLGGILAGFYVCGRDFLLVWVGPSFDGAWYVAVILMTISVIPLIQNSCVNVLLARNRQIFRSATYFVISVLTVLVSIILIGRIGYIGAAVASGLALLIGNVIIMNIYYSRALGIQVISMFKAIFRGIGPALLLSIAATMPLVIWVDVGMKGFIVKGGAFVASYLVSVYLMGLDDLERYRVRNLSRRLIAKMIGATPS